MVERPFWHRAIEGAWKRRNVVWLSGVRRVGKTTLCHAIDDIEYFDCELPRVRRQMMDGEEFLARFRGKRIALDEIHRLDNPAEVLKIAADHFPDVRLIATGSSTLEATSRFRDALTGRKTEIRMLPMLATDLEAFASAPNERRASGAPANDLEHRLLCGGLPPFFLSATPPEAEFQEWMDSYWARDIQELFRLEKHHSFQRFLELIFVDSGGIFEATRFAGPCEISRTTVASYLAVLEATAAVHVVRPYATRPSTEIVSAPRVYGFDTGFVCFYRGWRRLRTDDFGPLWEHYVLNELQAHAGSADIRFWRDKRGHEIDFVLASRSKPPLALECKWTASAFDDRNLHRFRSQYPEGDNWVVAHDVDQPFTQRVDSTRIHFLNVPHLQAALHGLRGE